MRLSLLSLSASLCLTGALAAQGGMSDEMREEIRRIVREEVRAALKEAHGAQATKPTMGWSFSAPQPAGTKVWSLKDGKLQPVDVQTKGTKGEPAKAKKTKKAKKAVKAFRFEDGKAVEMKLDAPMLRLEKAGELPSIELRADDRPAKTKKATELKAFRLQDGKAVEVKLDGPIQLDDVRLELEPDQPVRLGRLGGSAPPHFLSLTKPSGTRVLKVRHDGEEHDFEVVVGDDVAHTAIAEVKKALESVEECCEAVKAVKGECCEGAKAEACEGEACEGAKGECCEQGKAKAGQAETFRIEVAPVELQPKKAKAEKVQGKKAKALEVKTVDDVTEVKIREVLEKLHR